MNSKRLKQKLAKLPRDRKVSVKGRVKSLEIIVRSHNDAMKDIIAILRDLADHKKKHSPIGFGRD